MAAHRMLMRYQVRIRESTSLNISAAIAIAVALALASSVQGDAFSAEPGQPAPDIAATDAQGQRLQIEGLRGKLVYVDFWASWCAPCRRSFPWMNAMQEKYGASGFQVVAINVDQKRADADRFLAQVPANFTIVYDAVGVTPKAYAVKGMPSSVLVDPQGRVLMVHAGFRDEDRAALESKIRAALPQPVK